MWPNSSPPNRGRASSYLCTNYCSCVISWPPTPIWDDFQSFNVLREREPEAVGIIISNYSFLSLLCSARVQNGRYLQLSLVAWVQFFFLAIRRYLSVVMFFNDDGAKQPNPFRVISLEKNIQCQRARISRFPTIFRLATTKQTKKDLRCFTPNFTPWRWRVWNTSPFAELFRAWVCVCASANLVGRATYVNVDTTFLTALFRVRVRASIIAKPWECEILARVRDCYQRDRTFAFDWAGNRDN